MILNDLFEKKNTVNDICIYKPFLLIDNITLLRFFSKYNIPIDEKLTHLEYSREEKKILFNNMEQYISVLYPNWRLNVVENNKNLLNIDDFKKNCYKGKYGFSVEYNLDKISFVMFKKLVDELANEYKFERIDTDNLDELYIADENKTIFVSENYLDKISIFERYLLSIDLQELIEELIEKKSNISDNSFEDLETDTIKQESSLELELTLDNEESSESNNIKIKETLFNSNNELTEEKNKEYILRVYLNNYIQDIKIVDNISDNFKNEYLEGIIYVSVENDNYHIFDVNC